MIVRLQLFALAKQLAERDVFELQLPEGATVGDLRRRLVEEVPALADLAPHVLFAVDAEYAADATPIRSGAEVACIPPVSGG